MRSFVVQFRIARVVDAQTPEDAKTWGEETFSRLRQYIPTGGSLGPVTVLGPAGPDHIEILEELEKPFETEHGTFHWGRPTYHFPADDQSES